MSVVIHAEQARPGSRPVGLCWLTQLWLVVGSTPEKSRTKNEYLYVFTLRLDDLIAANVCGSTKLSGWNDTAWKWDVNKVLFDFIEHGTWVTRVRPARESPWRSQSTSVTPASPTFKISLFSTLPLYTPAHSLFTTLYVTQTFSVTEFWMHHDVCVDYSCSALWYTPKGLEDKILHDSHTPGRYR